MIIVLGVSIFATNFLRSIPFIFPATQHNNYNFTNNKEGFNNSESLKTDKTNTSTDSTNTSTDLTNTSTDSKELDGNAFSSIKSQNLPITLTETIKTSYTDPKLKEQEDLAIKFKETKKIEETKDFFDTQMTSDNIQNMVNKTQSLMKEQSNMMNQIKDFAPLLNTALQSLTSINSGNIGSTINTITANLDALYEKYPDSFPKNYKENSKNLKNSISSIDEFTEKLNLAQKNGSLTEKETEDIKVITNHIFEQNKNLVS